MPRWYGGLTHPAETFLSPLTLYCLEWHTTKSSSLRELLVKPLASRVELKLEPWDGTSLGDAQPAPDTPLLFAQLPPPPDLLADRDASVVWIPMWDHIHGHSRDWWHSLPKHLRVVAFSKAVAECSLDAGLQTFTSQFFFDPSAYEPAVWDGTRTMAYWNRTGLFTPKVISELCERLAIEKLLFVPTIDPGLPDGADYTLPPSLGATRVETVTTTHREEYLEVTSAANVFLAPRALEGVGLTFLEAMARGCAVLALDAPAMNEYITHLEDGFLLHRPRDRKRLRDLPGVRRVTRPHRRFRHPYDRLSQRREMDLWDVPAAGRVAADRHRRGFQKWKAGIPDLAAFLLEW